MTSTMPRQAHGDHRDGERATDAITIALVDDHQLVRAGLGALFTPADEGVRVVASVQTVAELRRSPGWGADVVLLDLVLADDSMIEDNLDALTAAGSRVVVVSARAEAAMVRRALRAGAASYVPKTAGADELRAAVRATAAGSTFMTQELATALLEPPSSAQPQLSRQELRTLMLYAGGMPMKSVARRLGVTEGCVKSYVDRIREKYQKAGREAPTKIDLYRRAVEDGYLTGY